VDGPAIALVMGVSGSGKTTVGAMLARRLGWPYAEADSFHPLANIEKMAAGQPLTDADRGPWLRAIAAWEDEQIAAGRHGVVSCSALRRHHRDVLRRPQVQIVYLRGSRALIGSRLTARQGHFFRAELLDSQFSTLEEPGPDEPDVLIVPVDRGPSQIVDEIAARLRGTAPAG
jgi:carbohydrate kinase (thermoresistant glucokinase family)